MKKSIVRVAIAATVASALVAGFATAAQAVVGTNTTQANGSAGPLNLFNGGTYQGTPSTVFAWTDNVIASGDTVDITAPVSCPVGSTSAAAFLAARGSESTKSSWSAYAAASFVSGTTNVSQANVKPAGLTSGTPGAGAVKAAGGNYSLGVACLSNSGVTVDKVFYRYIAVTATTGAWTAAATDYVYANPTITITQSAANIAHDAVQGAIAYARPHTTDVLNADVAQASIPDQFSVAYQWYANGVAVSGATAADYTTVLNDAGKVFTAKATFTRAGFADVVTTSAATPAVEGDAVVSGPVTLNATVVDAVNGQLSLSVPNNAVATLGSASLVGNYSTSTGSLGAMTVNDGRVVTRDGWDLKASATDFVNGANSAIVIDKSQLGIAPSITSRPSAGNSVAGSASTAGQTSYPFTLASSAAFGAATVGNTVANDVGATVVNAALTLVAPQWKPAGTYTSTLTLTVYSK
jgi:hypothetical protein